MFAIYCMNVMDECSAANKLCSFAFIELKLSFYFLTFLLTIIALVIITGAAVVGQL